MIDAADQITQKDLVLAASVRNAVDLQNQIDRRGPPPGHLIPCMNASISSKVSLPSLLVSIALKIRS